MHASIQCSTLASVDMLEKITSKKIREHAHHTLFLKNRYAHQVGLIHTQTFDPYTEVLIDAFIQCSQP